jgi:hypothetical protein
MDSAKEAVFAAESDPYAVQYGNIYLDRARAAIKSMEDAANSKRYDSVKFYAETAVKAAEQARIEGKASALRIREEAASNISSLRTEVEETSTNVNGARYSQLALDYDALDRGVKNAYVALDQAESSMIAEKYNDALDKAVGARSSLADINQKITNAAPRRK